MLQDILRWWFGDTPSDREHIRRRQYQERKKCSQAKRY